MYIITYECVFFKLEILGCKTGMYENKKKKKRKNKISLPPPTTAAFDDADAV